MGSGDGSGVTTCCYAEDLMIFPGYHIHQTCTCKYTCKYPFCHFIFIKYYVKESTSPPCCVSVLVLLFCLTRHCRRRKANICPSRKFSEAKPSEVCVCARKAWEAPRRLEQRAQTVVMSNCLETRQNQSQHCTGSLGTKQLNGTG